MDVTNRRRVTWLIVSTWLISMLTPLWAQPAHAGYLEDTFNRHTLKSSWEKTDKFAFGMGIAVAAAGVFIPGAQPLIAVGAKMTAGALAGGLAEHAMTPVVGERNAKLINAGVGIVSTGLGVKGAARSVLEAQLLGKKAEFAIKGLSFTFNPIEVAEGLFVWDVLGGINDAIEGLRTPASSELRTTINGVNQVLQRGLSWTERKRQERLAQQNQNQNNNNNNNSGSGSGNTDPGGPAEPEYNVVGVYVVTYLVDKYSGKRHTTLNARNEPGKYGTEVIETLNLGERLDFLGDEVERDGYVWYKVILPDGRVAWVVSEALKPAN